VESGKAISHILGSGILPSKLELMDKATINAVENYEPMGLPTTADALLLIELDGHPAAIEEEMISVQQACRDKGAIDVNVAATGEEAKELWKARKLVSPAIVRNKPTKISED